MELASGRVEQVGSTYDVCDALPCVVHNDGQLVGELSIGAQEHKIADCFFKLLKLLALYQVCPA